MHKPDSQAVRHAGVAHDYDSLPDEDWNGKLVNHDARYVREDNFQRMIPKPVRWPADRVRNSVIGALLEQAGSKPARSGKIAPQ